MTSFANDETDEIQQYDAMGRLLVTSDKHNGQVDNSYDILGNRTQVIDPAEGIMEYQYDAKNRLIAFTDSEGGMTSYQYDSMGRVIDTSHPNNTKTINEYDNDNRLSLIATYGDREGTLSSFSYTYDGVGNKLSMTEENGDCLPCSGLRGDEDGLREVIRAFDKRPADVGDHIIEGGSLSDLIDKRQQNKDCE